MPVITVITVIDWSIMFFGVSLRIHVDAHEKLENTAVFSKYYSIFHFLVEKYYSIFKILQYFSFPRLVT